MFDPLFLSVSLSFYPYLWLTIGAILGISAISLILLMVGVVGLTDLAFNYPVSEDDLTGWINIFQRSLKKSGTLDPSSIIEQSKQGRVENPFLESSDKSEEIRLKIEEIREIWSAGYNDRTRETEKLEPLLVGLDELNNFIGNYWEYFTPNEKVHLVTQANFLKQDHESIKNLTFWKWVKFVFPRRIFRLLKLSFKYYKEIQRNPSNHIFIQLQNANSMLAELILNRAKEDFELANLRQSNLEKVNARWEEQGQFTIDNINDELEETDVEKTKEDLEWEQEKILSNEYISKQAKLFSSYPKTNLIPYQGQYVFFEDNEIKDYDRNREDLIDRVYETVGYKAIYIKKVSLEN